ncbi:DUF3034 family protein [Alteromonadaceae bacterium M269]|nr:DUF3034 family protein [Alteromonadaceae bacterium M269]
MSLGTYLRNTGIAALALIPLYSQAQTGSSLLLSGGVTSFEGTAGGGIAPWALIGGYSSKEEINGTANLQLLQVGDYQLTTFGGSIGFYDRVELSVQRQVLDVGGAITSNVFNLLTDGAVSTAPSTDIEQDIIGLKVKVFGDAIFSEKPYLPQVSLGLQYKKNRDFDSSLSLSDGTVPLPGQGVPQILGATEDSGVDIYVSATNLWLGGAFGKNLLVNVVARATKANTFGLLGFESAADDSYDIEFEGSLAVIPSPNTAIGVEWRTQSNRLGGLAEEDTVTDFFIAYFPSKSWSATLSYVDIGNLPFESDANGFYFTVTANW